MEHTFSLTFLSPSLSLSLCSLVENADEVIVEKLTKAIEPCLEVLENSELAGAKVLVKNISSR